MEMILECSAGHKWNTEEIPNPGLKPGARCPMEISYDAIHGSTYCRRVLKEVKEDDKN